MAMSKAGSEASALRAILTSWAQSVRKQDLDGVLANHASNILMFDVVPPLQLRGIKAYAASWVDLFFPWFGKDGRFDLGELRITAGDRVGFATGLIHCAGIEHGKRVKYTIRLTVCFKKQEGRWMVAHEHHSEPVTTPPPS
jgi:ketosteroid isomerase-like protein